MAVTIRSLMLATAAILLFGHTAAAKAVGRAPDLKPADELVEWVVRHGGKVQPATSISASRKCMQAQPDARAGVQSEASVEKSPETGLRGLFAKADVKKGDIVVSVPVNISMDIGPAFWTHVVWQPPPDIHSLSEVLHNITPACLAPSACITARWLRHG